MPRSAKAGSPLLTPTKRDSLRREKIELPESLIDEATAYAEWAQLESLDEMVKQALVYVLAADKEWKKQRAASLRKAPKADQQKAPKASQNPADAE